MSKFMDNKQQLIHYATEILVLTGLVVYFSKKNKSMMNYIEDISQRLEDQEETIQKHEQLIKGLMDKVKGLTLNALQKQENSNIPIPLNTFTAQKVQPSPQPPPSFQCKVDSEEENCSVAEKIGTHKNKNTNSKEKILEKHINHNNLQFHVLDFTIGANTQQKNKLNQSNEGRIVELNDDDEEKCLVQNNEKITRSSILNNVCNTRGLSSDNSEDTDEEIQDELNELAGENNLRTDID
jgi:hypothetical protein